MGKDMYMAVETITPSLAAKYLEANVKNRKLDRKKVREYIRDIKTGKWQLSPQGISFYENGTLCDGQHRLNAIVIANEPVKMAVTYNVPNDTVIIDKMKARTTKNILDMEGYPSEIANNSVIGAITALIYEASDHIVNHVSEAQLILFVDSNYEALSKLQSIIRTKGQARNGKKSGGRAALCDSAIPAAAAFCALYNGISESTLVNFFRVTNSGFYSYEEETAAIVLRNYMMANRGRSDYTHRTALFSQTLSAIYYFVNHTTRQKAFKQMETPYYFANVKEYIKKYYLE